MSDTSQEVVFRFTCLFLQQRMAHGQLDKVIKQHTNRLLLIFIIVIFITSIITTDLNETKPSASSTESIMVHPKATIASKVPVSSGSAISMELNHKSLTTNKVKRNLSQRRYQHRDTKSVANPICRVLFPSSIQFLKHHKTGTVLARSIHEIIRKYCNISGAPSYQNWELYIQFSTRLEEKGRGESIHNENVKMHLIRDPVLTIISGFNYHMTSSEPWTRKQFSMDIFNLLQHIFNHPKDATTLYETYKEMAHGQMGRQGRQRGMDQRKYFSTFTTSSSH